MWGDRDLSVVAKGLITPSRSEERFFSMLGSRKAAGLYWVKIK